MRAYRGEYGTEDRPFSIAGQTLLLPDQRLLDTLAEAGVDELQVLPWLHYGGDPNDVQVRVASIYRFAADYIHR